MASDTLKKRSIDQYCPSCDASRAHSLRPTELAESEKGYQIATCDRCGLESEYPMPTSDMLAKWYANLIPPAEPLENPLRKIWLSIHDGFILRRIARYLPSGNILDIGAGRGRMIQQIQNTGRFTCSATEYSDEAIALLHQAGIAAYQGSIDSVAIPHHSIDLIFASHLVEHLPDLGKFLRRVRELLKPNGTVIFLVPSRGSLRAKLGLTNWHVVNPLGHLWSFDRSSMTNVLRNSGFDVLETFEFHVICELMVVAKLRS